MTAEEYLENVEKRHSYSLEEAPITICTEAMISFSQHHVREALLAASKKVRVESKVVKGQDGWGKDIVSHEYKVDKDSILNAYSLKNIK